MVHQTTKIGVIVSIPQAPYQQDLTASTTNKESVHTIPINNRCITQRKIRLVAWVLLHLMIPLLWYITSVVVANGYTGIVFMLFFTPAALLSIATIIYWSAYSLAILWIIPQYFLTKFSAWYDTLPN